MAWTNVDIVNGSLARSISSHDAGSSTALSRTDKVGVVTGSSDSAPSLICRHHIPFSVASKPLVYPEATTVVVS